MSFNVYDYAYIFSVQKILISCYPNIFFHSMSTTGVVNYYYETVQNG